MNIDAKTFFSNRACRPLWPLLGLLSGYPVFSSGHCSSSKVRAPVEEIYEYPFFQMSCTDLTTWQCTNTETQMSSFWRNFHHWLHRKLSKWQLSVQSVIKISSKWQHFRFSEDNSPNNRPSSQIPQCIRQISHNAPFCNRNVHISVSSWCIVGYGTGALWELFVKRSMAAGSRGPFFTYTLYRRGVWG